MQFSNRTPLKNSKNSSLPPSQTEPDTTSTENSGGKGKGKNVSGEVSNTRVVENVTVAEVAICDVCGNPLSDVPCHEHERRTKIDIIFEK
ncbi:hypothetical protein JWG39_16240, partial [Desulforhopalus vacuolatus]|nr:hypothetical protein [Desulforhopalus vacuolatus]